MWSGTAALSNIDQTLQTIRNDVVRLDAQLSQLTDRLTSNQRQRLKIINDIAAVRLDEIERGEFQQQLNSADRKAVQYLGQREIALTKLIAELEDLNKKIENAEALREQALLQVNRVSQQIVDGEVAVQKQLTIDEAYLAQLEKSREAESVAKEANQKVENAQSDMAEKAKPYQQDRLFLYLWDRGYGTTEYRGGLFARFMDGFVARAIGFEKSRVNYWNLVEIPKRLDEHADITDSIAAEQHMTLQQLEINALEAAGVMTLETQLEAVRKDLDAHDDAIEALEANLNEKLELRAQFVAGEDQYIHKCLTELTSALDHKNLQAIHRYVQATHSPTDDQLVVELHAIDEQEEGVAADLRDIRMLHDGKLNKLKELEKVRQKFKNSRFDDVRSGFGNKSLLASVLAQFINGAVSGGDVWRTIKRNQRYRNVGSIPDFGSGGLGTLGDILGGGVAGSRRTRGRRGGSTWHFPKPRRGGGGFRMPRGGGGGGFKTGGGF